MGISDVEIDGGRPAPPTARRGRRAVIAALVAGLLVLAAVTGFAVWQGFEWVQARQIGQPTGEVSAEDGPAAMAAAVDFASELTTIDWRTADADVHRVLEHSTGAFHDDFAERSTAFVDVVRQAKSVSTGAVDASGVESINRAGAKVLVAISVTTSNDGVAQKPRSWRMKIAMEHEGDRYVVSNVEFVP